MDLTKAYYDSEGCSGNILQIVKREPEWAANRIQEGEKTVVAAVKLIRVWHDMPKGNPKVWKIYWSHAPEMAPFRAMFNGVDPTEDPKS